MRVFPFLPPARFRGGKFSSLGLGRNFGLQIKFLFRGKVLRYYSPIARFVFVFTLLLTAAFVLGCSAKASEDMASSSASTAEEHLSAPTKRVSTIEITPNGPADTVRAFYLKLRERRIREALYLTNLRPAIEGLSDDELREFSLDFERIALRVPADIQITGEIISGELASVTANLPNEDDQLEAQQIQLKRKGEFWVILTVDPAAEARVRKEGKNYFRALKIDAHQEDAKEMLERVAKAQMVHSMQNEGKFADTEKLIELGLLPEDIRTSESTGYKYLVVLNEERSDYYATATPAEYGRTGINSYILKPQKKGMPIVTGRDNGGKPLTK